MTTTLLIGPTVEPVTLSEAKAHLRVDSSAEDTLIQSLIMASRLHIEAALDLALITQTWRVQFDRWPRSRSLNLPLRPVQSLTAVRVFDDADDDEALDTSTFILDGTAHPARLILSGRASLLQPTRAANGIEIDFVAGYGDAPADVPQPIRQALLLLTAHWYENREPVEIGASATIIPATVSELLSPYRRRRL
ncbi:MAG TPA: head-tail connector protein [Hyphomicrobiaceae bacterium]|nr:head-tail connector protein [Hyphomicrobiaceae bacterium]